MHNGRSLAVAGVGLIGASIALRAVEVGIEVVGYDPDPRAIAVALERGAISRSVASFEELIAMDAILVLAGPLEATLAQLARLAATSPNCYPIFDVASVKVAVSAAGANVRGFVASHPIAGSERSGPAAAHADLFEARTWTIDANADRAARAALRPFLEQTLHARVVEIASDEHDRTLALTSHLPQITSVALGALLSERVGDDLVRKLSGTGMRSMLRLGGSSWAIWRAVLDANSVSIAQEVRRLAAILSEAAEALEMQHTGDLAPRFEAAAAAIAFLEAPNDRKAEI